MAEAVLTQGTEIYVLAPTKADPAVYEVLYVDCPTAFNPGADSLDNIEASCLNETARRYYPGMKNPAQASMPINFDPQSPSHIRLYELQRETLRWAVGWSDGTGIAPGVKIPVADEPWDFDLPETRTWYVFDGFIENFPFNFETNSVVQSDVTIQRSGEALLYPKVANAVPPTPTPNP